MRLDKYLKVTRLIKRRTVANEACDAEKVVVNGKPARASYDVKVGDIIEISEGRHPVVEQMLHGAPFVPNDVLLDNRENQIAVITGPNMAGKSTYMRQIALITIMAQIGCFVPAKHARIGIVDGVYTRVGASDDLSAGQSTFMVEMSEVAEILKNATNKSLLITSCLCLVCNCIDCARSMIGSFIQDKSVCHNSISFSLYHFCIGLMPILVYYYKSFSDI